MYDGTPVPVEIDWKCRFIKGHTAYEIDIVATDVTKLTQELDALVQSSIILPFVYPEEVASGVAVTMYDAGESAVEAATIQTHTAAGYVYDVPANWTCRKNGSWRRSHL